MKLYQLIVFILLLTCLALKPVYTMDFEKQLKFFQNTSLWLPVLFENAGVQGEEICKVSGGSSCYNVASLGEGICKAGGGSSCYNVTSFGEGVCKANNGSSCYNVQSLTDGLCKAAGICSVNGALDLINQVIGLCGTKVLHFGFSRM